MDLANYETAQINENGSHPNHDKKLEAAVVEWSNLSLSFLFMEKIDGGWRKGTGMCDCASIEILGNIYENPELLT